MKQSTSTMTMPFNTAFAHLCLLLVSNSWSKSIDLPSLLLGSLPDSEQAALRKCHTLSACVALQNGRERHHRRWGNSQGGQARREKQLGDDLVLACCSNAQSRKFTSKTASPSSPQQMPAGKVDTKAACYGPAPQFKVEIGGAVPAPDFAAAITDVGNLRHVRILLILERICPGDKTWATQHVYSTNHS